MKYLLLVFVLILMGASGNSCGEAVPHYRPAQAATGPIRLMLNGWQTSAGMPDAPSYWQDTRTGMCFVTFGAASTVPQWSVSCGVVEGALIKMHLESSGRPDKDFVSDPEEAP